MAHQLPAVELFSTSILSNHAVRKRHERYTAVLGIRKIPYVYHDMASDEDAKKRWRIKARDPTIPGLLVHNEWRGTFAEFEEAVEYDELDLFLAIDHERLKREQELLSKSAEPAEVSVPESSSATNGTANGTGAQQASTKYTGEPPPPFAPEGTGKRRSLTADDFLKALGIDESSVDVDDAELSELLSDSSLRVGPGAGSEQPTPTGTNGRLKTNEERGIGAVAAARNAERKAQRAAPDEEKLKAQGLGPLAFGAPVEFFTTSMLANPTVRAKHERYLEVLSANQVHFRKYDLISEEDAKKRWRSKARDPQLPGILVHGEWRGSFDDFDNAAKNGPEALAEFLNIDDRLAHASVQAARKNLASEEPEEDGEMKLNPKRFTLGIDDFLSSLGVSDLKLDDLSIDDLLNDQNISTAAKSSTSSRADTSQENGVAGLRLKKQVPLPVVEPPTPKVEKSPKEEAEITEQSSDAVVDVPVINSPVPSDPTAAKNHQDPDSSADRKASPEPGIGKTTTAEEEAIGAPAASEPEAAPELEKSITAEDAAPVEEKLEVESEAAIKDSSYSEIAEPPSSSLNGDANGGEVDAKATMSEPVSASNDTVAPVEAEDTSEAAADKTSESEKPLPMPVTEADTEAAIPVIDEDSNEPSRASTTVEEDESTRPSADGPPSSNHAAEGSGGDPSSSTNATSPPATVRKPRKSKSRSAVASPSADDDDPVSPGRRALDYQRPILSPSSSTPISPSPLSPERGINTFAAAIERSGSSKSNLSVGGTSARNRSGSGSAKKGLGSRLSSMKFGKDRDRSSPSSTGLGSPGGVSEDTDSPTRRRASGERGGGLFKSRSRSPGRHKGKDKDRGNAPPLPSIPRDRISAAQRAERTLSQILRDADEAMRSADAQMLSSDEDEGGDQDENGDIDEEDEGDDPFGADQVSLGVKKSSEGAAG
ncbi:hypothetical protein OC846_006579 [Tilletia horrida]|uniref:Uncharacterized protein n=1 Tax=Tilletia horrida TaxID=155126 RepID=A0AAN6GLD7_9BASI|nr:hypothetical protein OC846_006579 [Tilletia horrida]KAK0551678.1 hypothetical protein OC845_002093 [Tilletia horrida]KAK0559359.1 hypothetical protein OC861_006668 [Tilletia horrida]